MSKVLVLGASGYIGRHLIPILASSPDFCITAISANPAITTLFSGLSDRVKSMCLPLDDLSLELAENYDIIVNLACAGVAHQRADQPSILTINSKIAHQACLLASKTRHSLLIHLGSDMEMTHASFYSALGADQITCLSENEPAPSYYVLSKMLQTGIIRLNCSRLCIRAHVILTPNIYGGDDPPGSLMGAMRAAAATGASFTIKNPSAVKKFVHVNAFAFYINALIYQLLASAVSADDCQSFYLSSVDFAASTTVRAFACHQWKYLSSNLSNLNFKSSD